MGRELRDPPVSIIPGSMVILKLVGRGQWSSVPLMSTMSHLHRLRKLIDAYLLSSGPASMLLPSLFLARAQKFLLRTAPGCSRLLINSSCIHHSTSVRYNSVPTRCSNLENTYMFHSTCDNVKRRRERTKKKSILLGLVGG